MVGIPLEFSRQDRVVALRLEECSEEPSYLHIRYLCGLNGLDVFISTPGNAEIAPLRILIHRVANELVILNVGKCSVSANGDLYYCRLGEYAYIFPRHAICYLENDVGPYASSTLNLEVMVDGDVKLVLPETSFDVKCDLSLLLVKNNASVHVNTSYLEKLYRGYIDDGLIWALVRSGRVSRAELPDFIKDKQSYYWPRSDILRNSLYRWYSYDDTTSLLVYIEVLEQLMSQQNTYGGVLLPYVTAARMRNIYGAPQQLYAFESLYRGYQLLGSIILKECALKALECFLVQPPKCLGYYEVGNGIWFRWGSYHYLSNEPDKRENLLVLNTHLMGVVGFTEACVLFGHADLCKYAELGVKAVENLLEEFMDESGYIYYSIYTKKRWGALEPFIRRDLLGYHLLSSRLLVRAGRLLKNNVLVENGIRGCMYGYEQFIRGRRELAEELLKCFVECYRDSRDKMFLGKLIELLPIISEKAILLGYTIDEGDATIPPAIKVNGEVSVILLTCDQPLKYLVHSYSNGKNRVEFRDKTLRSGLRVHVKDIDLELVKGRAERRNKLVELSGGTYVLISVHTEINRLENC